MGESGLEVDEIGGQRDGMQLSAHKGHAKAHMRVTYANPRSLGGGGG